MCVSHSLLCSEALCLNGVQYMGELTGVPEPDEATLNLFGLIGYELVAVATVAATGQLVGYLKRGTLPEEDEADRA